MADFITGTVTEVVVAEVRENGHTYGWGHDYPVKARITLETEDGSLAYISTQVGTKFYSLDGLGSEHFHLGGAQRASAWPIVMEGKVQIARSSTPEMFPNAIYPHSSWITLIQAEDVITVKGTVTEKVSRKGNRYFTVQRAIVTDLWRAEQAVDENGIASCHCGYTLRVWAGETHATAHRDQCPECGYFRGEHNEGGCSHWRDTADYDYEAEETAQAATAALESPVRDDPDWLPF